MGGVRKACQGRPVDEDAIALLAQRVEEAVRARGAAEVPSHEVGLAILARCASWTRSPTCASPACTRTSSLADDFIREIEALREPRLAREAGQEQPITPTGPTAAGAAGHVDELSAGIRT